MADVHGILLVDKPVGPTSQTVVTKVRRALGSDKAGHTGTLDPFATGLLLVCLGRATKLAGILTAEDKEYRATVVLGASTDTDDSTGREISRADAAAITRGGVEAALGAFRGKISQIPPDFSAIQKDGERMYDRARKGETVEIEARDVVVHEISLEEFSGGATATAVVSMRVSKGTYVRAIARDLGRALGVGGHLSALRRTASGALRVENAMTLDEIVASPERALPRIVSVDRATLPFEDLVVTAEEAGRLAHGIAPRESAKRDTRPDGVRAIRGPDGALLALATLTGGVVKLDRVI